jgi:hypothetical protein
MSPEGMVHALETIHNLLKSDGRLIDIHPRGKPTPLYALEAAEKVLLGHIQETDDFIEYRQADDAIQNVINRNMYGLMGEEVFAYSTYAGSLEELSAHLKDAWSDAILEASIWEKADQLGIAKTNPSHAEARRIQIVEQIGIGALIPRIREI